MLVLYLRSHVGSLIALFTLDMLHLFSLRHMTSVVLLLYMALSDRPYLSAFSGVGPFCIQKMTKI